ncbi:CHASE9 sensor domain-containing protein [Salmonella enterica]|nr:CHASE9 sensor domain-containing protein [Salmonella enterica]
MNVFANIWRSWVLVCGMLVFLLYIAIVRYVHFKEKNEQYLVDRLSLISSELKGYFDKVEREGGALLDNFELFSGGGTIDLIIKQRVEKADFVSAIGWIANDGRFFYYMKHEDGGLDYYYQNAQGGRLFMRDNIPVIPGNYIPEIRQWYRLTDNKASTWSELYECFGLSERQCLTFTLRVNNEKAGIQIIKIDVNLNHLGNYLQEISNPGEVIFISNNNQVISGNDNSKHSYIRQDEKNSRFNVLISGKDNTYDGGSISVPGYPQFHVNLYKAMGQNPWLSDSIFLWGVLSGGLVFGAIYLYSNCTLKNTRRDIKDFVSQLIALPRASYFSHKFDIVPGENKDVAEIKKVISSIQNEHNVCSENLLAMVSFDTNSGFFSSIKTIEVNNKCYLAAGMICFRGMESVKLVHGGEKKNTIIRAVNAKLSERFSEFCDIVTLSPYKYLLLCRNSTDEFMDVLSKYDYPQDFFSCRNVRLHKVVISEEFMGQDVSLIESKLSIVLSGIRNNLHSEFVLFNDEKAIEITRKIWIARNIKNAISRNEIFLAYQPIIDIEKKDIVGAEALCRWRSSENGDIPPYHFISVAENIGLIHELGEFILKSAFRDYNELRERFGFCDTFMLHLNISPLQLNEFKFYEKFLALIREYDVDVKHICLEITETIMDNITDFFYDNIVELRANGVSISLDDFGCGLSNLQQFCKIEPDCIKIDASFTSGLPGKTDEIFNFIMGLAQEKNVTVIVEGVETEICERALRKLGVKYAQGFLYYKPLSLNEWTI